MTQALDPVTQRHVDNLARGLVQEFTGIFSAETIHRYISESVDLLGDSRINVYVPVLAHRFARERLDDPAGQDLSTVRRIRDELDGRVQTLIGELVPDTERSAN
jgi:hypothetical protein